MSEINERPEYPQPTPLEPHPSERGPWLAGVSQRRRWALRGLVLLALLVCTAAVLRADAESHQVNDQQTLVLGRGQFAPGSLGALRVLVRDVFGEKPLAGADVRVSLLADGSKEPTPLFEGQTDDSGSSAISFRLPDGTPAAGQLIVETISDLGRDRITQAIAVRRGYKLLLTTDKPLYQPGQTIYMRALALDTIGLTPAQGETLTFLVQDPRGNKILQQDVVASEYGVAAADLTLSDEVIHGDYQLSVSLGDTSSQKTVEVKRYVLPKFGVTVSTERTFYPPGASIAGMVHAGYFFDKPVAGGQVQISGAVYDVERVELLDLHSETDDQGQFAFRFDLPDYFTASQREAGQTDLALEVSVTDQAGHTEQTSLSLPIARDPIVIKAAPEGGQLRPGVENVIYLLTSYPDGRPARTTLSLSLGDQRATLETGTYGLAEFVYTPPSDAPSQRLHVSTHDESGNQVTTELDLASASGPENVLLRPDRAVYHVGDTMHLEILSSANGGSVYMDIAKEGRILSTHTAQVEKGHAQIAVDLSPDLFGVLELHAYKVLRDGALIHDSRVVLVDAVRGSGGNLDVSIAADRDTYRPGETARVRFQTRSADGPAQAALGLAVVDESVFALQRQDPGFVKLYFLLEKELREPKIQVQGFDLPALMMPTQEQQETRLAQDKSVRAAWADVSGDAPNLLADSRASKLNSIETRRKQIFDGYGNWLALSVMIVPVLIVVVAVSGLQHTGVLEYAVTRLGKFFFLSMFLSPCWALPLGILIVFNENFYQGLLPYVGLLWLAALAALALYAWRQNDERAKFIVFLTVAWVVLMGLLVYVADRGSGLRGFTTGLVLTYLAGLGGLSLFGVGLWREKARGAGLAAISLPLLLTLGLFVIAASPEALPDFMRAMGDPRLYAGPVGWLTGCGQKEPEIEVTRSVREEPVMKEAVAVEDASASGTQAPRLRQFFPETLYWAPEVVTDEDGFVALDLPLADSITTWRLSALANTQQGELGFATYGIRVFQDFFIDLDLPPALTQGDEIAVPVAVFNYLSQAQKVRLEVKEEPWFELRDEAVKSLTVAPNEIEVVYFDVHARAFGQHGLTVTAYGESMSDAIRRPVQVVPDGKEMRLSQSSRLPRPPSAQERGRVEYPLTVPGHAVRGTPRVEVKVYPGVLSQVVEGLENILRLPDG